MTRFPPGPRGSKSGQFAKLFHSPVEAGLPNHA